MFHRDPHDENGHCFGRRFARGERPHGEHPHDEHRGHGRHRGGGRHGAAGELRRFFGHGDLRLVILRLIEEKPRHGYEIIKAIEDAVAGAYSPSPGVIYPTLTLLEELGYVAVTPGEGARKLHEITTEGRAFLDANRRAVDALFARMTEASQMRGGGPAPQIIRAMENLKLALRLRQDRGPLSEEQLRSIAEAIDAAAIAIERS
jgi:DNA-binding PadR family transcriptional regulator